jgi:hypothetical protein
MNFYELLIANPTFVEEVKATIHEPGFALAIDNFITNKMFKDLAVLTPFYMGNRTALDLIVSKYNVG